MKLLILNARVCDPQSAFNGKTCDILVHDNLIENVQVSSKKAFAATAKSVQRFDANGANISPGWFDMRVSLQDPGYEYKEDIRSGAQAALAGGFTRMACLPSTLPSADTKSTIEYILTKSADLPVYVHPYGCISKEQHGGELAELYDMHGAGAAAFTDGNKPIKDAGLMMRALLYAKIFGGLVLSHPEDKSLGGNGGMHEGLVSTMLGIKGQPNVAEELIVRRDIELCRYTEGRVHFSHISSRGSLDVIRKAKRDGLAVTCDVAVANLCFTDENLKEYDSNFKLNPPLRGKDDRKALWDAVIDGTVDCIVSDHTPENIEGKAVEYEFAAPGMTGLQTLYALINMYKPKGFDDNRLVQVLSVNPRKILGIAPVQIEAGSPAELTIFNPSASWIFDSNSNRSKSLNSPLLNQTLQGKAVAVYSKQQLIRMQA